jgi:hypothetical protein
VVESTPLLRERSPKGYRGFESLPFRHLIDYQQVVRFLVYSWGFLRRWFWSVLHVCTPLRVSLRGIRVEPDIFLSRIGGFEP